MPPQRSRGFAQTVITPASSSDTAADKALHVAVLVLECVGEAVAYLGQFDDALRHRDGATLAVLEARRHPRRQPVEVAERR